MVNAAKPKVKVKSRPPLAKLHIPSVQLRTIASTTITSIAANIAQMDREMIMEALEMGADTDSRVHPILVEFRADPRANLMECAARHKFSAVALARVIREWAHACDEIIDVREQWPIMRGLAKDSLSLWADCPACASSGIAEGEFCKVCGGAGTVNVKKSDPDKLSYYLQTRGLISTSARVAINNNIMQGAAPQPTMRIEDIVTQISTALTQPALITTGEVVMEDSHDGET